MRQLWSFFFFYNWGVQEQPLYFHEVVVRFAYTLLSPNPTCGTSHWYVVVSGPACTNQPIYFHEVVVRFAYNAPSLYRTYGTSLGNLLLWTCGGVQASLHASRLIPRDTSRTCDVLGMIQLWVFWGGGGGGKKKSPIQ